jgi:hypothetical protein
MDKLKMHTPDIAKENYRKLAALFPDAVTETKDEEGNVVRAIDKDVLMQEINAQVIDDGQERYQFTWPDKRKSVVLANAPIAKTLRFEKEKSVGRDGTLGGTDSENIYIEGDNLDALKLLQETYLGKVKMIYIDPPYNTGNDFIYEDDYSQSAADYADNSGQTDEEGNRLVQNNESNGRFHTDWLNMLYPRLRLAKDLLSTYGLIFISINEIEVNNLIKICDDIFGSECYVTTFVWKNKYGPGAFTKGVASLHEYVVCYAKHFPESIEAILSEDEQKKYSLKDDKFSYRGGYITQPLATRSKDDRPNLVYPLIHNGIEIWPDKQWIWSKDRLYAAYQNGDLVINEHSGKYSVRFKQYLRDENGKMRRGKPLSLITSCFNQDGTGEIENLFGQRVFDFPKPTRLIKDLLSLTVNGDEDDDFIVVDFFSGSASSADALIQLNSEDSGKRKFIMVQLPEAVEKSSIAGKAGFETICDIGEERIRRASKKIKKETGADIDYGFRCFKVDSSNMKDVYYRPAQLGQASLDDYTDNIKEDRTPEDLLIQVMLDLGVLLSSKVEQTEIGGKKVFSVADGYLISCFDKDVTEDVVTEIAKRHLFYFVSRDSSMASDSVAANFEEIFKTYSPETVRKVL